MSETIPSSPPAAGAQTLTAQEAGHRLLTLIDSLRTPADFSLDRFKTVMRLPEPSTEDAGEREPGYEGFSEAIAGSDWSQTIAYSDDPSSADAKKIEYRLDYEGAQADQDQLDLGPACAMDYAAYRRALLDMGFQEGPATPSKIEYATRGTLSQAFRRGGLNVDIVTQRESAASEAKRAHACVRSIEVRLNAAAAAQEEG
ncbi:hypothetical protein [Lysobacter capsici]|uniref:hypothetical protein n=1 Tax=Lysobacter capsici TaxID=435897 RepID=UPI001C003EA7|nr:hypothetical protein [Lysobacter capsici]QWF17675.1 hypothetical protein KME82_02450 [Lysobacter capsici]